MQPEPVLPFHPKDFHCHLTWSEVVGYLGGRWDINNQSAYWELGGQAHTWGSTYSFLLVTSTVLTVLRAFPCRSRLGDPDTAATVEEEVRGC